MAKRSSAKMILGKQSSVYGRIARSPERIHHIDGSSKKEVSRVERRKPLRSWTIAKNFVDDAMLDAQAEKVMNPHGWSKKRNPICPSCFTQKALNGVCGCE